MKKLLIGLLAAAAAVAAIIWGFDDDEAQIAFPFEASDANSVGMFHYTAPSSAEKKIMTITEDIETLCSNFESLLFWERKVEERTDRNVSSFRLNLSGETNHELIHIENGVKTAC